MSKKRDTSNTVVAILRDETKAYNSLNKSLDRNLTTKKCIGGVIKIFCPVVAFSAGYAVARINNMSDDVLTYAAVSSATAFGLSCGSYIRNIIVDNAIEESRRGREKVKQAYEKIKGELEHAKHLNNTAKELDEQKIERPRIKK